MMPKTLQLSKHHLEEMSAHVQRCLPEEGCGLLAGMDASVLLTMPIANQRHSPVGYNMEPRELLEALLYLRAHNLEMLGSYHSHPLGLSEPSSRDIMEFAYPGTAMVILTKEKNRWHIRGFEIISDRFLEIALQISG